MQIVTWKSTHQRLINMEVAAGGISKDGSGRLSNASKDSPEEDLPNEEQDRQTMNNTKDALEVKFNAKMDAWMKTPAQMNQCNNVHECFTEKGNLIT